MTLGAHRRTLEYVSVVVRICGERSQDCLTIHPIKQLEIDFARRIVAVRDLHRQHMHERN